MERRASWLTAFTTFNFYMENVKKLFCLSATAIFFVTGIAKILSASGNAEILQRSDPLLGMSFRHLILIAAILELAVAGVCLFGKSRTISIIIVAWLAAGLLTYRLGLWWIGWRRPCSCLGNLTDAIHVSPQAADNIMKGVLAYLLVGSYATLFSLWRQRNRPSASEVSVS